jgi:hypothetical protein
MWPQEMARFGMAEKKRLAQGEIRRRGAAIQGALCHPLAEGASGLEHLCAFAVGATLPMV